MANGLKKWSELSDKKKTSLGDKWSKIQSLKGKKPYGPKGAAAWLKAQGIAGTASNLKSDYFKTLKRTKKRFGN
jgi:hypothetical protein